MIKILQLFCKRFEREKERVKGLIFLKTNIENFWNALFVFTNLFF
jgi:hypothetical protein